MRLTEAPVNRRDDPRARRFIVDHVEPGAEFTRKFEVVNLGTRPANVRLYAANATVNDGGFIFGAGAADDAPGEWLSIRPTDGVIPPGRSLSAEVTISVPANAESGEYYAGIMAEQPAEPGLQVGVAGRVGIRVYLSVGTGDEPETDFELPAFRPIRGEDGRPAIEIDGCNTGERAVDIAGSIDLENGPGGTGAGPFETRGATTLAPDQCHTFTIPLDKELPLGPWDATAKLRSGKEERTAQARITFPKEAGERGKKVETREVTGTLPGIIATGISILLLLLLAGWLFWFLLKRRKRKKDDEEEPGG